MDGENGYRRKVRFMGVLQHGPLPKGYAKGRKSKQIRMKINVYIHLLSQVLAQTAVASLVPAHFQPYFAAVVAILGVLVAFFDQTAGSAPTA